MAFTGWDQLQPELVEVIANCLTAYIDYIRFRAVCVSWRSAVSKFPNHHHLPTQIPWLMIPFYADESTSDCGFFRISEDKFHILELPECTDKHVCGSSLGWLLMLEKGPAVDLFNPITRTLIQLPSLTAFPLTTFPHVIFRPAKVGREFKIVYDHDGTSEKESLQWMQRNFIRKMVLSSSPNDNGSYTVVIILQYAKMAFMKKGDQFWTVVEGPDSYATDIIFHKGQFFAIDIHNRILIYDFDGHSPKITAISSGPEGKACSYLVDFSGDLLLIRKTMDHNRHHTLNFEVFKPDQSQQQWQWHKVEDLGNGVLFLGPNSSVSLRAHEISSCQRNCIYFADNFKRHWHYAMDEYYFSDDEDCNDIGSHDIGVFDLSSGSVEQLLDHLFNNWLVWPPPTWVTPNPC